MDPKGTIVFTTVGLPYYGFDVFSVVLPPDVSTLTTLADVRLTDGVSVNFNAQFIDSDSIVFVSERPGRATMFRTGPTRPEPIGTDTNSLFHDRPTIRGDRIFFASAHERPSEPFKSWSAVYSTRLDVKGTTNRLTPIGTADFSPAVSRSGELLAVASHGSGTWKGEFHDLDTEIVVFPISDPKNRISITKGGWPCWAGDRILYFHRKSEDGWWSVYRAEFTEELVPSGEILRITPPGVHAFTPAARTDGRRIAVATRRKGRATRQIEIFDLDSNLFQSVTELINPSLNHYNPFYSPDSAKLGYHRFRGESYKSAEPDQLTIPHLTPVITHETGIRLVRLHGSFPSFSPSGDFIAHTGDFINPPGLMVDRSDGSRRMTLIETPTAFYTSWSPKEDGVVYVSLGPVFESTGTKVQVARVEFDPTDLHRPTEKNYAPLDVKVNFLTKEETGNNAFPACSPDGKHVVFRSGRSGRKNLYIIDAVKGEFDGGEIRRLTDGEWIDTMPNWSPKGDLIGFSSNRHCPENPEVFGVYLVKPDGTGLRRVAFTGPKWSNLERVNHVCFSPDGEWLLFTANFGAVNAEPISLPNQFQPYGDLYVCRLDGTSLRRLTCNAYENGTSTWHNGPVDMELGRLSLAEGAGVSLMGQFDEPLWLTCDI